MGYRHSRDEILAAALATASEIGLSQLSFGRVARRLGISDRTVVYYFPTKDDLVTNVVLAMGAELQTALAAAFDAADDHVGLVRRAWPVVTSADHDRVFALFFEANGLAIAGRAPFDVLVPQLVTAWIDWLSGFATGTDEERRTTAEAAVAIVDGLLLLRRLAGADAADRAARALGVS